MRTKMSTRSQIEPMVALVVLVVAALACNAPAAPATPTEPAPSREAVAPTEAVPPTAALPPTRPPSGETVPVSNARGPGFAAYPNILVSLPAAYDGYTLPLDPAALRNYDRFTFGDAQEARPAVEGERDGIAGLQRQAARRQGECRTLACRPRLEKPDLGHARGLLGLQHEREISDGDAAAVTGEAARLLHGGRIVASG